MGNKNINTNFIASEVIVEKGTMAMSQETPDFKEKRYGKKTVLSKKKEESNSGENSDNTARNRDKEVASSRVQKSNQAVRNIRGLAGGKSVGKGRGMSLSLSK